MSDAISWAPLYIKPIPLKTTEEERRAAHEYARTHLVQVECPSPASWDYFTTDPTDRRAYVVAIARPGAGGENSHFGDLAYVAGLYLDHAHYCTQHENDARAMVEYCTAHEDADRANEYAEKARRYRADAEEYRAAAARIRAQWTS